MKMGKNKLEENASRNEWNEMNKLKNKVKKF